MEENLFYLSKKAKEIQNMGYPGLFPLAHIILEDKRFPVWSGSSKPHQHHYGKGGLIQHTREVIDLCFQTNAYYGNPVPLNQLFLAALYHDSGKMFDYTPLDPEHKEWEGNSHKRKIHHISRSGIIWSSAVKVDGFLTDIEDEVLHAILSHHGQREWGSPVAPATKLAWILHLCDGISARMDDCEKFDRFDHNKK